MSEKLKQLIANNTLSVRQAKTIEELAEIEETLFKSIESLFSLQGVSQQRELLKGFIDTDIDVDLVSGRKCRLLKHTEESFLIHYNHNDQIEWVGISELNTKSL